MEKINVVIADDHKIMVDGIVSLLSREENIEVVAQVDDGTQAVEFIKNNQVDVAVMDISMKEMDGPEATRIITKISPNTKVLILSMHATEDYIDELLDAGCSGYILKNRGQEELVEAINRVHGGTHYYGPDIMKKIVASRGDRKKKSVDLPPQITDREKDVLRLIADGLTAPQIAKKLFITENTVNTHSRNMRSKLGVKNVNGLVRYAIKIGLVE
ncbi:MAG: response regulator [Crocinitomicaceae bacterium]